jgi:hypothetical protein
VNLRESVKITQSEVEFYKVAYICRLNSMLIVFSFFVHITNTIDHVRHCITC